MGKLADLIKKDEEAKSLIASDSSGGASFIKLIQDVSPERRKDNLEKYVEGCESGDFIKGTDVLGTEFTFVPVFLWQQWTEWIPRNKGGGLVQKYTNFGEARTRANSDNDLVESIEVLMMLTKEGKPEGYATFTFSGSKRRMGTTLTALTKASAAVSQFEYKMKSYGATNKSGQPFYNVHVEQLEEVTVDLYKEIQDTRKAVIEGLTATQPELLSSNPF